MKLEVCTDQLDIAKVARQYRIDRLEICSALSVGGLTPSVSLVKRCVAFQNIEIHTMIRIREGNFVYSSDEVEMMAEEIEMMANLGVHGVVFGCLNTNNAIHTGHTQHLTEVAKKHDLEVTFHRAFDFVKNPAESLEKLISMGVDRVLTSGQEGTALEGIECIKSTVAQANDRIQIMAGSGVNETNAIQIAKSGVDALHFSAHSADKEVHLGMGSNKIPNEEKVKGITSII